MQINLMKQNFPKLYKHYKKAFKKYSKANLEEATFNLDYFITYLQYLRDMQILFSPEANLTKDKQAISLCTAVEQYELYMECLYKYYCVSPSGVVEQRDPTKTHEEIAQAYSEEKISHWNNFWSTLYSEALNWNEIDFGGGNN